MRLPRSVHFATFSVTFLFIAGQLVMVRGEEGACMKLSECEPYLWMLRNRDRVPSMSTAQVFRLLYKKHCGFDGEDPKVLCPAATTLKDDDDGLELVGRVHSMSISPERNGVFENRDYRASQDCIGSLLFLIVQGGTKFQDTGNEAEETGVSQVRVSGRHFRNLKKHLDGVTVIHVESEGNCCYKMYSRPDFRGVAQHFPLGYNSQPEGDMGSFQEVQCLI